MPKQPGEDFTVGDWVDAMESGRYKMITGHLGTPGSDSHCALGVLYEEMGFTQEVSEFGSTFLQFDLTYQQEANTALENAGISPVRVASTNDYQKDNAFRRVIKYVKDAACRDTVIGKVVESARK